MCVADILKRIGWVKKDLRRRDSRKGWEKPEVGDKVGDKKALYSKTYNLMSPTSPTFSEKNNSTPENNNHMQNPKTEI
jgi:hypothetical protein